MKINNYKTNILVIIIVALLVTIVFARHSTLENNNLNNDLTDAQNELMLIQNELITVQENYRSEIEKSNSLAEKLETANTIIDTIKSEEYISGVTVTNAEIDMLAKTVWGEARGCNTLEQSAVIWCILNRVDAGYGTIAEVITAPSQFHGYSSGFPVTNEIRILVEDVVTRWKLEKLGCGSVGRTLPSNYLYFSADGTGIGNVFRTKWSGNYEVWNWNCWNPYS